MLSFTQGHTSDHNRLLLRMGTRAAEGGGGRMRANAEVPPSLLQAVERSSMLFFVCTRGPNIQVYSAKEYDENLNAA